MDLADVASRSAANCAGAVRVWGERCGHRTARAEGISAVDFGLARQSPMGSACLLAPARSPTELDEFVNWAELFFAGGDGGPIQLWSAWPTLDLGPRGYRSFEAPGMIRPAGGGAPPVPSELAIGPARSANELAEAGRLADAVFRCAAPDPTTLYASPMLGEDLEVLIGRLGPRVVATSMAFVSDGFCGVYAVATDPQVRGRGYGEALTWAAALFRPDLPTTLQASPMGLPIYRRMGFEEFGSFTVWFGPRPAAGPR
jgi:GNAT superfamily N-acetyltransferase